jgi:hypothetical protein
MCLARLRPVDSCELIWVFLSVFNISDVLLSTHSLAGSPVPDDALDPQPRTPSFCGGLRSIQTDPQNPNFSLYCGRLHSTRKGSQRVYLRMARASR